MLFGLSVKYRDLLRASNFTLFAKILNQSLVLFIVLYLGYIGEFVNIGQLGLCLAMISFLVPVYSLGRHIGLKRYYFEVAEVERSVFASTIFMFTSAVSLTICVASIFILNFLPETFFFSNRLQFYAVLATSLVTAINQPLIGTMIISQTFYLGYVGLLIAAPASLAVLVIIVFKTNIGLVEGFLFSKLSFEAVLSVLFATGLYKSGRICFSYNSKFLSQISGFANSLTPELILSQAYNFVERSLIKLMLGAELLGLFVLATNIYGPLKTLLISIKAGFTNFVFSVSDLNVRTSRIFEGQKLATTSFVLITLLYGVVVVVLHSLTFIQKIDIFLLLGMLLFVFFWGISNLYSVDLIANGRPLQLFFVSIVDIPICFAYFVCAGSAFQDKRALYFVGLISLMKLIIVALNLRNISRRKEG